jgi:outer membrane protein OmpA-like peptidoglycan-associated protein
VLDLPVIVEAVGNNLNISYVGENKNIEKHTIDLSYKERSDFNYKAVLAVIGIIVLIATFFFTFIYFIPHFLNTFDSSKTSDLNKKNSIANSENELTYKSSISIESSSIASIEKSSSVSSKSEYTLQSLKDIIKNNTPLYFEIDRDALLPGEAVKLDTISQYLKNYNKVDLTLNGHTESIGLPQNEMDLSVKRSNAIKNYLKNKVSDKEINFTIKGFGSTKPAVKDAPSDKQYLNRRVEIDVNSVE